MMGSAETRPLLDEFSPLVERKRANSAWGTRAKYALATLALVGVAAFAGVAMFPGAANNIGLSTLGDKSDFVAAEAPSMHHRSSVKPHSKLYVPRGSARLGEEGEAAPAAPTKAIPHTAEDPIESSGLDAKIAQLEADKAALEQSNADLAAQIATLTADTSAQDQLKKCQEDTHSVIAEKKTVEDELQRLEQEISDEREAHMKVGGFNCGRIIPGENRDEKLAECDAEMRLQLYERKKANQRKYQMRLQNDALHAEIEGLENKLLELDGEVRQCIADSAAAAQTAAEQLADANAKTEEVQTAMGKVEYELELCMNGKKACDTKVHDMEGELKDMEAREDKCEADFAQARKMYQDSHATKDEATKQLESDISRLELDITSVKDKRDSLEKELNEKFVEIKTLEKTVADNQAAAEEANNAKSACEAENGMISASIEHLKNDAKRMEQTLNMTRDSKLAMVDEVMRLNQKMEGLEGEILEADNKLKTAINASAAEKAELVGKAMEKDEQIAAIKTEVASLKAQVNVSAAAELALQARLADAQDKAAAAQLDLEAQISTCQTDFAAARDAFQAKHMSNDEASKQLKEQITQLETTLATTTESCKQGKETCKAEIDQLHADINAKSQEIQNALATVDAKSAEIDVCYAATDKLHTENAALIGSVDTCTSDLATSKEEKDLCEGTKNGLLDMNKKCEASVEKCEADGAAEREVLLKKHADKDEVTQQLNTDLTRVQGEVAKCQDAKATLTTQVDTCDADINAAKDETKAAKADFTELKMQPWCQPPNPPAPDAPAPPPPQNPPGAKKFAEKLPISEKKLIAEGVASAKAVKIIDAIMLGSDITSDKVRPFVNLDKKYSDASVSYIFAHCYADEINMIAAEVTVEGGKAYLTAQGEGIRSSANCRDEDLDAREVTAAWANQLSEDEAWTEYGYMPGASLGGVKLVNADRRIADEVKALMPVDAPAEFDASAELDEEEKTNTFRQLLGGGCSRQNCGYHWGGWSGCSPSNGVCGWGSQSRCPSVYRHPSCGGSGCPGCQSQSCFSRTCPPPPSPSPPPPSPSPPPPSPPPPSPPPPKAKLGLGTIEYVIVNNVGGLEMGGKGKPMYTPSDAFLSIPEVATMKVGDAVMMAKAYKNGQPTEEEAPVIFAACDGDSLKLVSATVTAAHGSSFIALGEAKSSPKSGCDNAALTAGAVMDAFKAGDAAGSVSIGHVYFTQADDGDEVPTANTAVVLGEASAPVAIELKSACFIGSSIGVDASGCRIAKAFPTDKVGEFIFATCKDEHMTMVVAQVGMGDIPAEEPEEETAVAEEPEEETAVAEEPEEEEAQEPLTPSQSAPAPSTKKSKKKKSKRRKSKRRKKKKSKKKKGWWIFGAEAEAQGQAGRSLLFAPGILPDISSVLQNANLPVWVTDKAQAATVTVTKAMTTTCTDGAMTAASVKAAASQASGKPYGPALSIGRVAWTDHDTTQTDVIDAVKTTLTAPPPKPCTGRTVTVKRMDPAGLDGHGWGMNLEFMCGDSKVSIGNSRGSQTQSTVVNTPMFASDCAARIDKSNWLGGYGYGDFFDVTVGECPPPPPPPAPAPVGEECTGRTVTVKRMDAGGLDGHGWGMNLEFMCGDSKVSIGNSRGSQTQSTVVNTPMFASDCAARIDKSNWLGGYGYGDFFDVTVGECPKKCKRTISATRKDANHGWGMNLKFKCGDAEVVIGNSDQAEKTVFYDNVATGTCPSRVDKSNWLGGDTYGDYFDVVMGECIDSEAQAQCRREVTATRGDAAHGWGMPLEFECGGKVVHIGSSGGQTKSATTTFKLDGDDCPSRVDKSNWRGGHTYGDWFSVNVGPCVGAALGDAVEYDHEDKPKLGSKTKLGKKTEASANTWKAW